MLRRGGSPEGPPERNGILMKKFASIVCAAAMASVLFAGCGNTEVGGSSTAGTTSGGASTAEKLSGDLKFAGSSSMADIMAALSEEFKTQYPDVTITVTSRAPAPRSPA